MNRNRTVLSHTMHAAGTPEAVFPLLCPVREYEWIEGWDCDLVFSSSGKAELDCVFRTAFPQDGPEDTWIVSLYEPPRAIEFVRVNPLRAIHYTIHLAGSEDGRSAWIWSQTLTGLTDKGNALVTAADAAAFAAKIVTLEHKLNHFLATGTMLRSELR